MSVLKEMVSGLALVVVVPYNKGPNEPGLKRAKGFGFGTGVPERAQRPKTACGRLLASVAGCII